MANPNPPDIPKGPFVPPGVKDWEDLIRAIANATISYTAGPGMPGQMAFQFRGQQCVLILNLGPAATSMAGIDGTFTMAVGTKITTKGGLITNVA